MFGVVRPSRCARARTLSSVSTGAGNRTVNVAPQPSPSLCARTVPPCSSTRCRTIARPRPRPPIAARRPRALLAKAIEDVRQELRRDPDPVVGDDDVDRFELSRHGDADAAARLRELHRVRQQVPHHLLQPFGIGPDRPGERIERRVQPDLLRFGGRMDRLDRRHDHFGDAHAAHVEPQLAADDARAVEQIADEARLRLRVALDGLQRRLALLAAEPAVERACAPSPRWPSAACAARATRSSGTDP